MLALALVNKGGDEAVGPGGPLILRMRKAAARPSLCPQDMQVLR